MGNLYAGSIPIIKKHISYKTTKDLPVLYVDSFEEITEDYLNEALEKINEGKFNYDKLNTTFWMNIISSPKIESKENQYIKLSFIYFYKIKISYKVVKFKNRLKKNLFLEKIRFKRKLRF